MKRWITVAIMATLVVAALAMVGCGTTPTAIIGTPAQVGSGVQTVNTTFGPNDYAPITVQKGVPVEWTITIDAADLNNCNNRFLIPEYDLEVTLQSGQNVVRFTPDKTGTFPYACWMGMITSEIAVVDDLSAAAAPSSQSAPVQTAALNADSITPSTDSAGDTATKEPVIQVAQVKKGVATVDINVVEDGYDSDVVIVEKGMETTFRFAVNAASCAQYVVFPQLSDSVDVASTKTVTITPTEDFDITCTMAMYGLKVRVVDDINGPAVDEIKQEVLSDPAANTFTESAGCACCG